MYLGLNKSHSAGVFIVTFFGSVAEFDMLKKKAHWFKKFCNDFSCA